MTAYPQGLPGRVLLGAWLIACGGVLLFAFVQRHDRETDILVLYLMLMLTFPIGLGIAAIAAFLFTMLHDMFGIVVPGGFLHNLVLWCVLVAAGYLQWFIGVPWAHRRWRQSSNPPVNADAKLPPN